jgi:hypothetical protein
MDGQSRPCEERSTRTRYSTAGRARDAGRGCKRAVVREQQQPFVGEPDSVDWKPSA